VTISGLLLGISGRPASATPADTGKPDDGTAAVLRQQPGTPDCAQVRPDPATSGRGVCILDPRTLPPAARAQIDPKVRAYAQTQAVQCQLDTLDFDRTTSCVLTENAFRIFDKKTGAQLGYGDFSAASAVGLDVRSRQWTQRTVVTLLFAEGEAKTGFLAFASAAFPDGSGFTAGQSDFLSVTTLNVPVNFDYPVSSPGSATVQGRIQPRFVLTPLAPVESPPIEYEIGEPTSVRCDSTPSVGPATGGCVYHQYVPTYDVSTMNNDTAQVAWHILWAQRNLVNHWGWQGHGPALTRTRDLALIRANRRVACGGRPPAGGKSCDEYPFATTQEGASRNSDYSWHMVPARQNSLEGSRYRRPWYNSVRLLEGDKFWVNVVLPPGQTTETVAIPDF
jgi:hypothetical protein